MIAESEADADQKIRESLQKYREHTIKYLSTGIKMIPAKSVAEAKAKFDQYHVYESNGQIAFV